MIDWYVEISEWAPDSFNTDKLLNQVIETSTPFMNYFCERLSMIEDCKIENVESIFGEIVDEMPIMNYRTMLSPINGEKEFVIVYNKYVYIKLTDTTKQIYREIKLTKILR